MSRSKYLSIFLFLFCGQPERQNLLFGRFFFSFLFFFFLSTITRAGRLNEIKWSACISKSKRILCVSFSGTDSWLCKYHLFLWPNLNFLHYSHWITLPIQSCLVFELICRIRLCDWSFRLYHDIIYICYFVEFCRFLFWRCSFVLLLLSYSLRIFHTSISSWSFKIHMFIFNLFSSIHISLS